jgi:hypothetical protein
MTRRQKNRLAWLIIITTASVFLYDVAAAWA